MAAFALALARVRNDGDHLLLPARLDQLARTRGCAFRNTRLTPGNTLALFARQIASGNVACAAMHHLADARFSDAAWCQARSRLPLELIDAADRLIVDDARRELDRCDDLGDGDHRWRGHRLLCVDGTSDSMPDTPELRALRRAVGRAPGAGLSHVAPDAAHGPPQRSDSRLHRLANEHA